MTAWGDRADACLRRLKGVSAPRVAEIGVGYGKMSKVLVERRIDINLVMVDSYLAADDQPDRYKATRDNFAKRTAANAAAQREDAEIFAALHGARFICADSVEAAGLVMDSWFDLVFIDGDHSMEGVARDIEAWWPKVRPGGWMGGHDYANDDPRFDFSGVAKAVDWFCATGGHMLEIDSNFTWWVKRK